MTSHKHAKTTKAPQGLPSPCGDERPDVPASTRQAFETAREISPRRHTTCAADVDGLVREQLEHFGLTPDSEYGGSLASFAGHLYGAHADLKQLWDIGVKELETLSRSQRIERFAAQKFLCFQLAKLLDTLQNPFRKTYQSLVDLPIQRLPKGPYPVFDNVTAIFSSRPAIARTATYIYACAEWVDDAFHGKEMLLEVYSRLLNPTSICLANHIVDIEAGPNSHEYLALNFDSGMAAIDCLLAHLVGHRDIILSSRNVYGGTYQLMHDWYAKNSNLDVAVHFFDGYTVEDFARALNEVQAEHRDRLAENRRIYVFIETPCNPHGYVLDLAAICKAAHQCCLTVIADTTIGTPFLCRPLQSDDLMERPDFVIHSYTKDLAGHGETTGGVVIGRNERMMIPKGEKAPGTLEDCTPHEYNWDESMYWNVYYVKGAFMEADKAFNVLTGMHTLELRMIRKAINTLVLSEYLSRHPDINVNSNAAPGDPNAAVREKALYLGLPAPLFTFDFEREGEPLFDHVTFERFFDHLDPVFGHQVSLGQMNTVVLCPAITSHSEMGAKALREAGIGLTTTRVAVGAECSRTLIAHLVKAAEATLDTAVPGFSKKFPPPEEADAIFEKHYMDVHRRYMKAQSPMAELLK